MIAGLDGGVCGLQDGAHIWTGPAATRLTSGFIVDCNASRSGFGAVLHQGVGPIAFFRRVVVPLHAKLAACERELIGLVKAVEHWPPYLWARLFTVCTDHFTLKYLLDQRLSTIPQHT